MQTETAVATQVGTVTRVKMLVATVALAFAAGSAFVITPPIGQAAPAQADMAFSASPTYVGGTLTFPWGNVGTAGAKFPANKVMLSILAVDANGNRIPSSILVGGGSYGNPYYYTSGNDGTGYYTIPGGKIFQSVLKNTVFPTGTVKIVFTLDQNNLVTESNESNNTFTLSMPSIDMAFNLAQPPTFQNGTITFQIANYGNTPATIPEGQNIHTIEALDVNNVPLVSISVGGSPLGYTPWSSQAGMGGQTYNPGVIETRTWSNIVLPNGTAKVRITLDPNNVLTESNESNNVYVITLPQVVIGPRTTLTTAWASDTPNGPSAPSYRQTIGKLVIYNSGTFDATVNAVNINIQSSRTFSAPRLLEIFANSPQGTRLASTLLPATSTPNGITTLKDADFTDVTIAPGNSKTFFITLDTQDMKQTDGLSINIPASGVIWSDGILSNLTSMGQDLPTIYKTFTY